MVVVLFHLHMLADSLGINSSLLGISAKYGEFGVDVFFVLSGFLMIYTTRNKNPGFATALEFMRARIIRIAPLYWILTIMFAGVLFALPKLFDDHPFDFHHLWTSLLFIPSHNSIGEPVPVIYTGWTLNFEMFFYVVFAAVLCLTRKHIFPIIAATFISLSLFNLASPSSLPLQVYTNPMLLEFVAGTAIALIYINEKAVSWTLALLCLLGGLLLIPMLTSHTPHRFIHYGIPAALVVFGALTLEKETKWLRLHILRAIGDSSYSLYLTHAFTLPIIIRLIHKFSVPVALHPTIAALTILTMCVVVAHATYMIVEKPTAKWAKTKRSAGTSVAAFGNDSDDERVSPQT
jgi:hypothetical protein